MIDLVLAVLHHLLVFALVGTLAAEFTLARGALDANAVRRLAMLDGLYGGIAGAVIAVGVARVFLGLRGWEYYVGNWAFWAKMAAFAATGLMSIPPTLQFRRWLRDGADQPGYAVPLAEIADVRRWLHGQLAMFPLILVFAAMMARGFGY